MNFTRFLTFPDSNVGLSRKTVLVGIGLSVICLASCGTSQAQISGTTQAHETSGSSKVPPVNQPASARSANSASGIVTQGFDGSTIWQLTPSAVRISTDGGTSWSSATLPSSTPNSSLSDVVAATSSGDIWLGVLEGGNGTGVTIYHKQNLQSDWSTFTLTPTWSSIEARQPPPIPKFLVGPGPTAVLLERGGAQVGVSSALLVYNGSSFIQQSLPTTSLAFGDGTVVFLNSQNVVAQDGNDRRLFYSTDGGKTWSGSSFNNLGLPAAAIGKLVISDGTVYLPVALKTTSATSSSPGSSTMGLYASTDGGKTYHAVNSSIGVVPSSYGLPVIAALRSDVWLAPFNENLLYESTDGGATWKSVVPTDFSTNPSNMILMGSRVALSMGATSSCASLKNNCSQRLYLLKTTDGGHTWQNIESAS